MLNQRRLDPFPEFIHTCNKAEINSSGKVAAQNS